MMVVRYDFLLSKIAVLKCFIERGVLKRKMCVCVDIILQMKMLHPCIMHHYACVNHDSFSVETYVPLIWELVGYG